MKSARGFTLIELLVAIMILTLFLAASMGAIRIASRSWEAGHTRANATEEMRAVTDFLRRQFAQMPALTWSDGDVEKLMFAGDEKQLRFVAAAPQFSQGAGLLIYTLAAQTENGIDTLTLRYAPFDPGAAEFAVPLESEQLTLATGFDAVSFAYYGAAMQDDRPSWSERWRSDAERYPTLIRLRAHAADDSWPELEFAVRQGDTL